MASTTNQTSMTGPKNCATAAVPRDCAANRATRMATVTGSTASFMPGATSFRPSTADSTEMAGVITASP